MTPAKAAFMTLKRQVFKLSVPTGESRALDKAFLDLLVEIEKLDGTQPASSLRAITTVDLRFQVEKKPGLCDSLVANAQARMFASGFQCEVVGRIDRNGHDGPFWFRFQGTPQRLARLQRSTEVNS